MTQPEIEQSILQFWRQNNIFQKSLDKDSPKGEYVFYDGPPFATGTPHYGHIVASLIKDMVPRYFTMSGYHVARRWGWDCHGLPIENMVEEELGFKHKKEIVAFGLDKFNEKARSKVLKYADEWRVVIDRLGRWVDMDNAYRTMDRDFMESVWWVFKQLWDKGLIYEGFRSLHICPRCETTLSQSEVSEGYQEVEDLSVVVKFLLLTKSLSRGDRGKGLEPAPNSFQGVVGAIKKEALQMQGSLSGYDALVRQEGLPPKSNDSIRTNFVNRASVDKQNRSGGGPEGNRTPQGLEATHPAVPTAGPDRPDRQNELYHILSADAPIFLLAWTTTPWTLPGNAALAVRDDIEYALVRTNDGIVALAKTIFDRWSEEGKISGEIVAAVKGKDLAGLEYESLFSAPGRGGVGEDEKWRNAFKVYSADFVNTDEGTGIVHIAPAFGEDDRRLGEEKRLPFIQHVRMDGTFAFGEKHQTPNNLAARDLYDKYQENTNNQNSNFQINAILNELNGLEVKPKDDTLATDKKIVAYLFQRGLLFSQELYRHSYPHCWRCESPLLHYSASSYFVAVTKIKDKLLRAAEGIRWVPEHIKDGRFGQWLENGRDWSISRQRFWGSVIPIWRCSMSLRVLPMSIGRRSNPNNASDESLCESDVQRDVQIASSADGHRLPRNDKGGCGHTVVIGSAAELEKLSGKKVKDLHKHFVDKITFKCAECGGMMRRLPDVLDCWFESGSMPYAAVPVPKLPRPFGRRDLSQWDDATSAAATSAAGWSAAGPGTRDKDLLPEGRATSAAGWSAAGWPFPARFIAEGVDQTRAWFYYLHVLAVALFGKAAFQNAVANGIVLAEDGQKMSKRLQNYPDPSYLFDKYGADAVRYYLAASPVMRAEDLNFSEKGVEEAVKKVLLTLYNVLAFYKMYANNVPSPLRGEGQGEERKHLSHPILTPSARSGQTLSSPLKGEGLPRHILDQWILSKLNVLICDLTAAYESYDLNRAVRPLGEFISELSTWYVRRSRERFKGGFLSFRIPRSLAKRDQGGEESLFSDQPGSLAPLRGVRDDSSMAVATLRHVLLELAKLMAPVMPFTAEHLWQEVRNPLLDESLSRGGRGKGEEPAPYPETSSGQALIQGGGAVASVHLQEWPKAGKIDQSVLDRMNLVRKIVELGLAARAQAGIKIRQPLASATITGNKLDSDCEPLIMDELNVWEVKYKIGDELKVVFDTKLTDKLRAHGNLRELIRAINAQRKKAGLTPGDKIILTYQTDSEELKKVFVQYDETLKKAVIAKEIIKGDNGGDEAEVNGERARISINRS